MINFAVKLEDGVASSYPSSVDNLKYVLKIFDRDITLSDLEENNYAPYNKTDIPAETTTKKVVDNGIVIDPDTGWAYSDYEITDKESAEIDTDLLAAEMRTRRDEELEATDWWATADRIMTAEQTSYRQALRDITSHSNWPMLQDSDWPTKP